MSRGLALVLAAALVACGGGGGGGGGGPTVPTSRLTFAPSSVAGPGSIALSTGAGSSTAALRLDLVATGVAGLYGVAFDLTYPNAVLRFAAATEGPFLSGGGAAATSFQLFESSPGRLVVGISRLGPVGGVDGSGVLLSLELRPVAQGGGSVGFALPRALDASGREISGLSWIGGSVEYVP